MDMTKMDGLLGAQGAGAPTKEIPGLRQQFAEEQEIEPITLMPLWDRVLVRLVDVVDRESVIFMDATTASQAEFGVVEAVGPTVPAPWDVQTGTQKPYIMVGDVVKFGKFSGYLLEQGEEKMLLRAQDVSCIVKGGKIKPRRGSARPDEGGNLLLPDSRLVSAGGTPLTAPRNPNQKAIL